MSEPFFKCPRHVIAYLDKLSVNAIKLYLHLLACKNQKTGLCCPSWDALGWPRSRYYAARVELSRVGLCAFEGLKVVFPNPEIPESENPGILESRNLGLRDARPENHGQKVLESRTAYKEEQEESNKKKSNKKKSSPPVADAPERKVSWTSEFYDVYTSHHNQHCELPYSPTDADWGQLKQLKLKAEKAGKELTVTMWTRGVENYFKSVVGKRSICDLATYKNFITYYQHPLNDYGKPEHQNGTHQGRNGSVRESAREQRAREILEFLAEPSREDVDGIGYDDTSNERFTPVAAIGNGLVGEVVG